MNLDWFVFMTSALQKHGRIDLVSSSVFFKNCEQYHQYLSLMCTFLWDISSKEHLFDL